MQNATGIMSSPTNKMSSTPPTYSPTQPHECACCGEEIMVDYSKLKSNGERVRCPHCNELYGADADAEFIGGVWTDKTKLWRV